MSVFKNMLRKVDIYGGLPRSIYILSIIRVVNAMGNFVYPFLTPIWHTPTNNQNSFEKKQ
jgi:hypothetical protein